MKILPFQLPNSSQLILLSPVSVSDRTAFLILLSQVKSWWKQAENHLDILFENEGVFVTIQNMINMIPRRDVKDEYGFSLKPFKNNPESLSTLILNSLDYLHTLETLEKEVEKKREDEDYTPFSLPSSGDNEADLIADLSQALGAEGAIDILDCYDLQTVNHIIKRLNSLNMAPEKLEKLKKQHEMEEAQKRFKKYAKEGKFDNIRWIKGDPFKQKK